MTERSLYSQVKKRDANANATANAAMASTGFQNNQNQINKERNFSPSATSNFGGFNHNNDQVIHQTSYKQQNLLDNADNPFFQIDVRNLDQFHNLGQTQSIQKEPLKIPSINPNRNHYESKKSQRSKSGQRSSKNSVNQIQNSQMNPNMNNNLQVQGNNPQLIKPHQQSDAAKIILNEYLNQHSELLQSINNTNNLQKLSHYIRDGVKSSIGYHGNRRDDNNNTSSRLNYTNDLQTSQNFNNLTMNGPTKSAQEPNQNNSNNSNRRTPYQLSDGQNQDQQNNNFHLSKKYINSGSFFTRKNQQTNNYLQSNDQHNIPQIPLRRGDSGLTSDDMGAQQNLIGLSQTVGIPAKNNSKNANGNNLQQNKSVKLRSFTPNLRQYKTGGQVNSSLTHRGNLGSIEKGREDNEQRAYPNFRSNTNSRENLSSSKYKFKQIPSASKGMNNNSLSIMPLNSQPNQQHLTTDVLSTQEAAFKTENDIYTQPQMDKYQYYIMNTNPDQIPTNQRSKKQNSGQNYIQNQNGVTNSAAKLGDEKNNSSQSSLTNNQNNIHNKNVSSPTSNSNGNLNSRPKSKQSGQRSQLKQRQDEKMEQIKQIYLKNDKRSKSSGRGSKLNEIPEQGYNQNGNYLTDSQKSIPKQRNNNPFYVQQISHQLEEFGDEVEEIDVTEMFKKQSKLQQMDYNHNLQFQQIKTDKNSSASKQNKRYQNKDLEDSDLEGTNSRLRQSHLPAKGSQQSSNNTQNDVLGTTGASVTGYSLNHLINNDDNTAQQKTIRLDDINDSFHTEVNPKRVNDSSQSEKTQSSQNKNTSSIYAKVIQKITQNNGSQLQNSSKLHAANNNSSDQKQIPNQTNNSILSTSQQGFRRSASSFSKQKIGTENSGSNQKNQMNQSQNQQRNNQNLQNQENVRGSFSANPSVQNLNNHNNNENNLQNLNNQSQQQRSNSKSQIRKKTISQTGSSKKSQSSFEQYPDKNQKNENEQISNQNNQLNQQNQHFFSQNQANQSSSKKEKINQKPENQDQQGGNKDKQQKENNQQNINLDKQANQQAQSQQYESKNDKNNSLHLKKENKNLENQINSSNNKNNNPSDQQLKNATAKKEGQNEIQNISKPPLVTNSNQANGSLKNNDDTSDKNNSLNQVQQQRQSNYSQNKQKIEQNNQNSQNIEDKITLSQIKQDKSIVIDSDMAGRLKSNDSQQQSSQDDKNQQVEDIGLKEKQSSLNESKIKNSNSKNNEEPQKIKNSQDNQTKLAHNQKVYPQKKLSNDSNNQLNKDSGISSKSTKENGIKSQIQQIKQDIISNIQEQNDQNKSKDSSEINKKQIKNEKDLSDSQQKQKKQNNESKQNSDENNLNKIQQNNSQQNQNEIDHALKKSNQTQNESSSIKQSHNLNSANSQDVNQGQNSSKQKEQSNKMQTSLKQNNDNSLNNSKNQNVDNSQKNQIVQNNHQQLEDSNTKINQIDQNNKNSQLDQTDKKLNSKINQEKDLNQKENHKDEEINKYLASQQKEQKENQNQKKDHQQKDLNESQNSKKDHNENLKKIDELEKSTKQKNINENHKNIDKVGEQHVNQQKDLKESQISKKQLKESLDNKTDLKESHDSKKDQQKNLNSQDEQDKSKKNAEDNQKINQKNISQQDGQLQQSDSKKDLNQKDNCAKKQSIVSSNSQVSNPDKNDLQNSQNSNNKLKNQDQDQQQSESNSSKNKQSKDKNINQKHDSQNQQQLSQNIRNNSSQNLNDSDNKMQKSKKEQDSSQNNSSKISQRKDSLNKNSQSIDGQSNLENKLASSQRKNSTNKENSQKDVHEQESKNDQMKNLDKKNTHNQSQLNESSQNQNNSQNSIKSSSQNKINQEDKLHSHQPNQQGQNLKELKEDEDEKQQCQGQDKGQDKINIDQNSKIINETNGRANGVVVREIREQNGNELRIITEARIIIQNENKDDNQGGKKQKKNNQQENDSEEEDCEEEDQSQESKLKKAKKKQKNDKNNKHNKDSSNLPLESQLDSDDECESYENGHEGQLKKRNKKAKMINGEDKQFLEDQVNLIDHQNKGQNKGNSEKRNSQSSQKTKEDASYIQNTPSDYKSYKAEQSGMNTPNKNNTDISNFIKAQDTSQILLNEEIQRDPQNNTYDESINDQNSILAQLKSNQGSLKNLNPINNLNNQQDQQHPDNSLNLNYQEEILNEINTDDKQKKENTQKENQKTDQQSGINQGQDQQNQKTDASKKQENSQNNGAVSPSQNKKQTNKYKEILNKNLVQVQRYPIKETEGEESLHIVHDDTSDEHDQIVKVKILQDQQTRNSHSSYESLKQIRKKGENNTELDEIEKNKLNSLTPEELLDLRIQQNKRRIRKINRRPHIIKQDMEKLIENAIIFDIKCRLPKNIDFIEEIKTDPRHGELAFGRESYLLDSAPKIRSFRGYDQEMMRPCAMLLYLIDQYCDPQIVKEWHLMQHFQYNAQIEENRFLNLQMNTQKNSSSLTESNVTKKNFYYGSKAEVSTSQNIFLNPTLLLMDSPLVYEFRHFEYNFFLEVEDFYPIEQILLNRFKDRKIYEEDELIFIFTSLIECVLGFRAKNICLGNIQIEHVAFCPASNSYKFFNLTKAQVYEEQNQEKKYNIYYSKIYQPPEIADIEGQKDHGQVFNIFAADLYALGITLLCFKYHLISNNRTSNFIQNRIEMCKNSMQLSGIIINYLLEQNPKQRLLNMKLIQKDLHNYLKKNSQVDKKLPQQEVLSPPPPSSPLKSPKYKEDPFDAKPGIKLNADEFKNEKLIAVNAPQNKQQISDTEDSDEENLDQIYKNSNILCISWSTSNNKYFMHRSSAPDYELEVYWNEGKSINNQKLNPPSIKKIAKQIHDRIQSAQDIARMYKYTFQWEKASNQYINNLEIMKQQSNKVSDSEILRTVNQIWQSLYYNNELEDSLHYNEVYFNNIHTLFIHDEVQMAYDHLLSGKLKWILNHKVDSSQDFDIALMCTEQFPLDKAKVLILLGDFFAEDSEISAEQYYKDALEILQAIILNQKDVMKSSTANNFMKESQATVQTTEEEQDFDDLFEREEYVIMKLKERTQHQLAIIEDIQMSELREKLVFLEENSQKLSSIEKAKIQLDVANQYCHQFLKYAEADYYYQEALSTLQFKQPNRQSSEAMRSSSQQKMATSTSREKRMKKSGQLSEFKEAQQQQQQLKKNTSSSSSTASINIQNTKDLEYDILKFRIVNYLKMNNEDEANKMIQKIVADNTPENGIKNIDNILQLAIILEENLFHEYCLELYNRCYALATVQLGAKNEFTLKLKDKINKL